MSGWIKNAHEESICRFQSTKSETNEHSNPNQDN
jgi:hypothetical protein